MTDNDFSCLTLGMIFVEKYKREWVIEDCTSLIETDAVFPLVVLGLLGVPFEYQRHLNTFPSYGRTGRAIIAELTRCTAPSPSSPCPPCPALSASHAPP